MAKKKELTIEEICFGMPKLRNYFKRMENQIKRFEVDGVVNPKIEALKERKKNLLKTIKNMDSCDLCAVYYLQNIEKMRACYVLNTLKEMSDAVDKFNFLNK